MSALPILVEWGHVISKVAVGGLAGLGLLGFRAFRNHRDVTPAREDARRMGLSIDEPREGPIALRGTYRTKDGNRWLECSGQRVVLDGDVKIVRGSAARWKSGARTYLLSDGDRVIAIGRMERRASTDASAYREAAGGWQLGPSVDEPIQLCLAAPVPCPRPLWPIRGVLALGIVGVAAYFGLGFVGKKLVEQRDYPDEAFFDDDGASTFRAEIAAALPKHRDMALRRYEIDLRFKPQTEEVIAQHIAVARMHSCQYAAYQLHDLKRYEQAIEVARDCDHPEYARKSLVALGHYDEAAKITTKTSERLFGDNPLVAMIGAGRWRDAAAFVESRDHGDDAEGDRCLARHLRSLGGDPPSDAEPSSTSRVCRMVDGVFDDRREDYHPAMHIACWAFGPCDGGSDFYNFSPWFAPHVSDSGQAHSLRAELAIDLGRFDVAAAEMEKAIAARGPNTDDESSKYYALQARRFANSLALRTGKPIERFVWDPEHVFEEDEAALLRAGANVQTLTKLIGHWPTSRVPDAVAAAAAGDGRPLARAFETFNDTLGLDLRAEYLLAVAPMITKHRDELARVIRNRRRFNDGAITALVHELAIERDLLRMLGDTTGAARLQTIIDRHAKALGDLVRIKALLFTL